MSQSSVSNIITDLKRVQKQVNDMVRAAQTAKRTVDNYTAMDGTSSLTNAEINALLQPILYSGTSPFDKWSLPGGGLHSMRKELSNQVSLIDIRLSLTE